MPDAAVILAGGSGSRMRGSVRDKVLEPVCGVPAIMRSFGAFVESGRIGRAAFVCRDGAQREAVERLAGEFYPGCGVEILFCAGGARRQDSVLNGLRALGGGVGLAFIHDGARPLVGAENVIRLSDAARRDGAAVLAARVTDTIKRLPGGGGLRARIFEDLDRPSLWAMQTPQVFGFSQILAAYEKIAADGADVTDDVAAANAFGIGVTIVENLFPNPKITLPEDIAKIEFLLSRSAAKIP